MENVSIVPGERCYGCGACVNICPSGGVTITLDKDGYYKRQIHEDKCLYCGKCLRICPACSEPTQKIESNAYIAYCRKRDDVLKSSSGGIGHAIAKKYLEKGYAIIGATWSEDFQKVHHVVVRDESDLDGLRKSKYVQSDPVDAFRQIEEIEKVVVFGTPCQIAGLRSLYGAREGLVLVDFDCMGPAGLSLWHKYMTHIQRCNSSPIVRLEMRHKKKSWMMYGTQIVFANGEEYFEDKFHDPFCILYHLCRTIHETCRMYCKYLNASAADLRMGDAWNYTEGCDAVQIHDGLSLVMPLSDVGQAVVDEIAAEVHLKRTKRNLQVPIKMEKRRGEIFDCIRCPELDIMDAVALYDSFRCMGKLQRELSYLLSENNTLYLGIKQMIRHFR